MGVMISPSIIGMTNTGYQIIAAIPTGGKVNGQPDYYVVGDNGKGDAVTWHLAFQPDGMEWRASYNWGHYFHGTRDIEFPVLSDGVAVTMPAVERAMVDLVRRQMGASDSVKEMLERVPQEY